MKKAAQRVCADTALSLNHFFFEETRLDGADGIVSQSTRFPRLSRQL